MGLDEEEDNFGSSDEEAKQGEDDANSSTTAAPPRQRRNSSIAATSDDEGSNLPDKGRSVFSTESRGSRSTSTTGMPEISIRRRTRIAGVRGGDESNAVGSRPSADPRAIVEASRIITELEQDHGGLEFPLDALRRDSGGFGDDDDDE